MLGVKDIAFINSTLVFSINASLSDRDRSDSVVTEIIYQRKYRSDQTELHP